MYEIPVVGSINVVPQGRITCLLLAVRLVRNLYNDLPFFAPSNADSNFQ